MSRAYDDLARPEVRALTPYASARALADAAGILLNANENPFSSDGRQLNRYPDPQPAELRERLARLYGVRDEQLLITRGSDEGIDLLVRTFCGAGEPVLIMPPCFGMYGLSARVQGAQVVEAPLVDTGSGFEAPDNLVGKARGCKLVFLCSPNNPTGNVLSAGTIEAVCTELDGRGLVVIDEAYVEFQSNPSFTTRLGDLPNLVVLRTLSKAHALAGCRLGTVIADPGVIALLRRIIAPYPLPTPTVEAALTALQPDALARQREQLIVLAEQKARLVGALGALGWVRDLWPGEANFVLVRVPDAGRLLDDAAAAGIRLRNQSAQRGLEECVRITIGTPAETDAVIDFLRRWRP